MEDKVKEGVVASLDELERKIIHIFVSIMVETTISLRHVIKNLVFHRDINSNKEANSIR